MRHHEIPDAWQLPVTTPSTDEALRLLPHALKPLKPSRDSGHMMYE